MVVDCHLHYFVGIPCHIATPHDRYGSRGSLIDAVEVAAVVGHVELVVVQTRHYLAFIDGLVEAFEEFDGTGISMFIDRSVVLERLGRKGNASKKE